MSKFHNAAQKNRCIDSGAKTAYPAAEEALVKCISEFQQNELAVTANMIKSQMVSFLANDFAEIYLNVKNTFLVSETWFYQFLCRHNLALR